MIGRKNLTLLSIICIIETISNFPSIKFNMDYVFFQILYLIFPHTQRLIHSSWKSRFPHYSLPVANHWNSSHKILPHERGANQLVVPSIVSMASMSLDSLDRENYLKTISNEILLLKGTELVSSGPSCK